MADDADDSLGVYAGAGRLRLRTGVVGDLADSLSAVLPGDGAGVAADAFVVADGVGVAGLPNAQENGRCKEDRLVSSAGASISGGISKFCLEDCRRKRTCKRL